VPRPLGAAAPRPRPEFRPGCARPPGRPRARGSCACPPRSRGPHGGVGADDAVGALRHRDGALRILPQREARDAERRGLFLDAAGIRQHQARAGHERKHLQVPEGRKQPQARGEIALDARRRQPRLRARVHGKDQGQVARQVPDGPEKRAQHRRIVDVGRPVQGQHAVAGGGEEALRDALARSHGRDRGAAVPVVEQGVDHQIAGEPNARRVDPFPREIALGVALGGEQEIGELIGQDPVDLLRHAPIVAAQAGLHMHHGDALLGRNEGTSNRRVDVAHHQHRIRTQVVHYRLEAAHDLRRLDSMAAGTDLQVHIRVRDIQLPEKRCLHGLVVMLSGMDQGGCNARLAGEDPHQGCDLHEVRPRPDDAEEP